MLGAEPAELYGVETKALSRAVRRNLERFPEDFMFQLSAAELESLRSHSDGSSLRSQIVTSDQGGRRYLPYASGGHEVKPPRRGRPESPERDSLQIKQAGAGNRRRCPGIAPVSL